MNVVELIIRKRNGEELSTEDISSFVQVYTAGEIPDYQVSALLMAAFLRGLTGAEAVALTEAMLHSGRIVDLTSVPGKKVDKHSTGGVGDKISIALAPLVAAAGVPVPMISGRGLGHTGGTLDKLEAIPGFRTDLSIAEYRQQLHDIGIVMIGQTDEIAPADKKLYALRDVTGTVEYIPFIASSIMSKKLAEGIDALVLDVKWGRGAFMRTEADARRLAEALVGISVDYGKPAVAWLTDMNDPLGFAIGNWPETHEAIRCLRGDDVPQVTTLVEILAGEMICLGGRADSPEAGRTLANSLLASGAALEKFSQLIAAQGGDPAIVDDPEGVSARAFSRVITAPDRLRGVISGIDPYALGRAAVDLGAGRASVDDDVDPLAGIVLLKKPGDTVQPGEPIARLQALREDRIDRASGAVGAAFESDTHFSGRPLMVDRFEHGNWAGSSDGD